MPTTQSKGHKSRKPTVEDVEDNGDKVRRGQSTATTPSPELDSDDELSVFVLQHFIIISSWAQCTHVSGIVRLHGFFSSLSE